MCWVKYVCTMNMHCLYLLSVMIDQTNSPRTNTNTNTQKHTDKYTHQTHMVTFMLPLSISHNTNTKIKPKIKQKTKNKKQSQLVFLFFTPKITESVHSLLLLQCFIFLKIFGVSYVISSINITGFAVYLYNFSNCSVVSSTIWLSYFYIIFCVDNLTLLKNKFIANMRKKKKSKHKEKNKTSKNKAKYTKKNKKS